MARLRVRRRPLEDAGCRKAVDDLLRAYESCSSELRRVVKAFSGAVQEGAGNVFVDGGDQRHEPPSEASHRDGVMVALSLPGDVAAALSSYVDLGEGEMLPVPASEMHVTLCYCGRIGAVREDQKEALAAAVKEAARRHPSPLSGWVGGIGRFAASKTSDGKDVVYASIDLPGLPDFRQELVRLVEAAGLQVSKKHGYSPHATLGYADADAVFTLPPVKLRKVSFESILIKFGDEAIVVPLGGVLEVVKAEVVASVFSVRPRAARVLTAGTDGREDPLVVIEALAEAGLLVPSVTGALVPDLERLKAEEDRAASSNPLQAALLYVAGALDRRFDPSTTSYSVVAVPPKSGLCVLSKARIQTAFSSSSGDRTADALMKRLDEMVGAVVRKLNDADRVVAAGRAA